MSLHPEKPERLEGLLKGIRGEWQTSFGDAMKVYEPDIDVTEEQLRRVHTQQHIDVVADASFFVWELARHVDTLGSARRRRDSYHSRTLSSYSSSASPGPAPASRRR